MKPALSLIVLAASACAARGAQGGGDRLRVATLNTVLT